MGLRPARTCRDLSKTPWARFSRRTPRKSFVKAMPHNSLQVYSMGNPKIPKETEMSLVASEGVQVRDNALESARQAANKYLEKLLPGAYYLVVRVFPHNVIRENKMILGAGADRLQKGMRKAYGRPMDRAARIYKNQPVFTLYTASANAESCKEAFRRAKGKLPGKFDLVIRSAS